MQVRPKSIFKVASFASFLLVLLSGGKSFAAVRTWTGGGIDTNFSTVGNWTGATVPVNGDSLAFPQPPVVGLSRSQSAVNDIGGLTSIAGVTVDTGTGEAGSTTVTLGAMTVTGYVNIGSAQALAFGGATTTTAGTGGFSVALGSKDSSLDVYSTVALGPETLVLSCPSCTAKDTANVRLDRVTGTGASKVTASRVKLTIDATDADATYPGALEMNNSIFHVSSGSLLPFGASSAPLKLTNSQLEVFMTSGVNMAVTKPLIISGNLFGISNNSSSLSYTDAAIYPNQTSNEILEFSGSVTLLSDIVVEPFHGSIKFSGPLSGDFLIGAANIHTDTDQLIIAASPNTTKVPTGTYVFVTTATLADSQPSLDILAVKNGTVEINGRRGRIIVSPGSTLKGTGTVGDVNLLGTLAPGNSPGCFNTGNLTMSGSATLSVEISGNTVCTQYDQTKVTGTVTLANAALSIVKDAAFKPAAGKVFTIIDNDGADAVVGTFAGAVEGATVTNASVNYKISYKGGTGNDVTLTVLSGTPNTGTKILGVGSVYLGMGAVIMAFGASLYLSRRANVKNK
jgi:fibronectin-binding autotransporter adhesin